jgi:hypothetical protein
MPLTLDPIARRKLVLTKQLFQHAVVMSAHHGTTSRILALVSFDLSAETALRATVSALDPTKTPADGFQALVQQCDDALAKFGVASLPDRANIQHVHGLRNDAQHKAKYPNESDVSDARTYVRDFVQKLISQLWNVDFSALRMTELVQDEKARRFLTQAEEHLEKGETSESTRSAAAGLGWALACVERAVVGHFPSFTGGIAIIDSFGRPASDYNSREALRALERMQDTLLYVALGLDYAAYMRCRQIAGTPQFTLDGTAHFFGGKENAELAEGEFVLAFCTDSVVQIESRVGNLDAPFGSDRWY